ASPNPVQAGNNISYTQVVVNTGTAAATSATFTEVIPVNTTFQALTSPAGWTCSTPAVGGTGTISCTDPSVAAGSDGTFQVQVQVNSGVTPPSTITDTVTVSPGTAGSNSVTTTDPVASSTQADLALSSATSPSGQVLS